MGRMPLVGDLHRRVHTGAASNCRSRASKTASSQSLGVEARDSTVALSHPSHLSFQRSTYASTSMSFEPKCL